MNRVFYALIATILVAIITPFLSACGGDDEVIVAHPKGIYKIEVSITGDLEGFVPSVIANAGYDSNVTPKVIYDTSHRRIDFTEGFFGYNYDETPEVFSTAVTFSTTEQATGLLLLVSSSHQNFNNMSTTHVIKIHAKGYLNGKLIKEETVTTDNSYSSSPSDYKGHWKLKFELGKPQNLVSKFN